MSKNISKVVFYRLGVFPDIHQHIGRYTMDKSVVKEFDGHPIYNTPYTHWFLATTRSVVGEVIAFSTLFIHNKRPHQPCFGWAYTAPEFRGRGIYSEMISQRIEYCKNLKTPVERISVQALPSSQDALLRLGFEHTVTRGKWWTMVYDFTG